jgi:hypothetical protein
VGRVTIFAPGVACDHQTSRPREAALRGAAWIGLLVVLVLALRAWLA